MNLIPITATIEALLAECVGGAPERVQLGDWRTIALHFSRLLDERGLMVTTRQEAVARTGPASPPEKRARLVGSINPGEVVVALADGSNQAVVISTGPTMASMPEGLQDIMWRDMLTQAVADLRQIG